MTAQSDTDKILLICTVGGSPEPIIKSILTLKPEKICFLASENTEGRDRKSVV